jgi:hypothetical protein
MTDPARTPSAPLSFAALLVDEWPDALMALSVDGRICSWNRGAQAMFGYAMKGDDEKASAAGCDGDLSNPIDTGALPRMVAGYLGQTLRRV